MQILHTNRSKTELHAAVAQAMNREEFKNEDRTIWEIAKNVDGNQGIAERAWFSTDNCPGGRGAVFFLVKGADGVERLGAHGDFSPHGVDVENAPWFDGSKRSRDADEFVAIFDPDEAKEIVDELSVETEKADPYREQDYAQALMRIFLNAIRVPYF